MRPLHRQHQPLHRQIGERGQHREGDIAQGQRGAGHTVAPTSASAPTIPPQARLTGSRAANTSGSSCICPRWVRIAMRLFQNNSTRHTPHSISGMRYSICTGSELA